MNPFSVNNKPISLAFPVGLLLFFWVFHFTPPSAWGQEGKSRKMIKIDSAKVLYVNNDIRRLISNVRLSHQNLILFCDSAWSYPETNAVDAFGKVHIISNDTLNLFADFIHYDGQSSLAKAFGKVKLKDPRLTLTTDTLDYDMTNDIGYYNCWGTVVDSSNTLTSRIGRYYSNENLLFFKDSVVLTSEKYTLWSDTLKYNTKTEVAYIVGPTRIESDTASIYSEEGWFDTRNQISELLKNSTIRRSDSQLQADTIYYDDTNGSGYARSNVVINDFANEIIVAGHYGRYNDFNKYAMVTDSAMFVQYHEGDSLFLHSDTIFVTPDSLVEGQKIIYNYNHVRFYRTDLQGICDSLVYSTNDSTIRLYTDPVLWSEKNQMVSEDIEVVNNALPPNEIFLNNNAFIIQQVDSLKFNQIKGKNMVGYISGKELYLIDVNGNGQSIFYPEDDKGVLGANKAESSNIKIHLEGNRLKRISYITTPAGVMKPLSKVEESEKELEGFRWREDERPIDRFDIFRREGEQPSNKSLPGSTIDRELDDPQKRATPGRLSRGDLSGTENEVTLPEPLPTEDSESKEAAPENTTNED